MILKTKKTFKKYDKHWRFERYRYVYDHNFLLKEHWKNSPVDVSIWLYESLIYVWVREIY